MKIAYTEDYAKDYSNLSGLWDDFKVAVGSVAKGVASAVRPVASELVYRQVTGEALPPKEVVKQPVVVQKMGLPTWILPAGIGVVALLLMKRR